MVWFRNSHMKLHLMKEYCLWSSQQHCTVEVQYSGKVDYLFPAPPRIYNSIIHNTYNYCVIEDL